MLGSYCRYYSRHAIVVTTVVVTVAMENRMTTHVIFPHLRMPDVRHRFLKKILYILPKGKERTRNLIL